MRSKSSQANAKKGKENVHANQNGHQGQGPNRKLQQVNGQAQAPHSQHPAGSRRTYGGKSTTAVSKGDLPGKYVKGGQNDVLKFSDFSHSSLRKSQTHREGKGTLRSLDLKPQLISSDAKRKPVLNILEKGTDLRDGENISCCVGVQRWNGRRYAHELGSGWSSLGIASKEEFVEEADFIGDWKNVKTLLKYHTSDTPFSFVLHRIGNAVTIDELDLFDLVGLEHHRVLQLPAELCQFVWDIVGREQEGKLGLEKGRKYKDRVAKEAYHKLLHRSMMNSMEESMKNQFLHQFSFSIEEHKFVVGCDIPLFVHKNGETEQTVTVRARSNQSPVSASEAFDIWLDNKLVQGSRTLVTRLAEMTVTKTEWFETEELPTKGQVNPVGCVQDVEKLFQMLRESVKAGNTYWLYRAPGSYEATLHNLSSICVKSVDKSGTGTPVVGNWHKSSPFGPYFATASLLRYSECFSEALTEKLISETVIEPMPLNLLLNSNSNVSKKKKPEPANKQQKLSRRITTAVDDLKRDVIGAELDWVISDLGRVCSENSTLALKCIQQIYSVSAVATPLIHKRVAIHAVERYYPVCVKLLGAVNFKTEHVKFWNFEEGTADWSVRYASFVASILGMLQKLHAHVTSKAMDKKKDVEWMYIGSRLWSSNADIISFLSRGLLQHPIRVPPSSSIWSPYIHTSIERYRNALELMPSEESFRVKQCYVSATSPSVVSRKELQQEVQLKLVVALLIRIQDELRFPLLQNNDRNDDADTGTESRQGQGSPISAKDARSKACQQNIIPMAVFALECIQCVQGIMLCCDEEYLKLINFIMDLANITQSELLKKMMEIERNGVNLEEYYRFCSTLEKRLSSYMSSTLLNELFATFSGLEKFKATRSRCKQKCESLAFQSKELAVLEDGKELRDAFASFIKTREEKAGWNFVEGWEDIPKTLKRVKARKNKQSNESNDSCGKENE